MSAPIPASIRAELDQTPAWWDAQYRALVRKQIPRDAAYHEGHDIVAFRTFTSTTVRRDCVSCGVTIREES